MVDLVGAPSRSWARRSLPPAVAGLLAEARAEQGLTVAEAADRAGIAPRYLRQLEAGQRVPSTAVAEQLVNVYELAPDDVEQLRGAALAGVGRAWVPQPAVVPEPVRGDSEPQALDDLPPGIRSRIVVPSPYA